MTASVTLRVTCTPRGYMMRIMTIIGAGVLLLSSWATAATPASTPKLNWDAWKQLPVLDDGRVKPLDTFADEKVTLITGRSKWKETDPQTGKTLRTYSASELLYLWIAFPDEWVKQPILRCEFRPLRKLLVGEKQIEGTYVSFDDFIDWDTSKKEGLTFRSKDVQSRMEAIVRALRESNTAASDVGSTPEEKRLNGKLAEFYRHAEAFIEVVEARELFIIPALDPRILTEQEDPNSKVPAWISLGNLLKLDEWERNGDATVVALMAKDAAEMMRIVSERQLYIQQDREGHRRPRSFEDSLPQLAAAIPLQARLRPLLKEVKTLFDQTRDAYKEITPSNGSKFERALQGFGTKVREVATEMQQARQNMGPLKNPPKGYVPLPLDEAQMAITAYPPPSRLHGELLYNRLQPFYLACWFYGLATLPLLAAWILGMLREGLRGWGRFLYVCGLVATTAAIAFATYGFILRIGISGRPPVTNMYETVIWVAYVVSVMGLWFGILPLLWPGLEWSWRLAAFPYTWESKPLTDEDRTRFLGGQFGAINGLAALARIGGFFAVMNLLTQVAPLREYTSSFKIISLTPPITGENTFSLESLLTWSIGIATVLLSAWYVPRAVLAMAGGVITIYPELRRRSTVVWDQVFSRQFFLIGSIPVALFGMVLAYQVGNISPEILNPRIGSIAAVLNNNYWLTIHVLTIVSSYGAGALAWGLGNLAMAYYLFGTYRKSESSGEAAESALAKLQASGLLNRLKSAGKTLEPGQLKQAFSSGIGSFGTGDDHLERSQTKPPKEVLVLANFAYKVMQVAVLLLAAGTILGGLWADVSWGRFWDWDPKEVWALISLLAYLVFLHGRYAGWVGTFGTNAGSVLCFMAIMMSWYGVNFVLPQVYGWLRGTNVPTSVGMHSYATGAGGIEWVAGACGLNLLFVFLAWTRYSMETLAAGKTTTNTQPQETASTSQTVEAHS